MPDPELRQLKKIIEDLSVDDSKDFDYRCSRNQEGMVFCGGKEFKKDHTEVGGFVAVKSDSGSMEYIDTVGSESIRRRILRDLGKGALR